MLRWDNLIDSGANSAPGYSILTEERNEVFLRECRQWTTKQFGTKIVLNISKRNMFKKAACEYIQNVCVLLYLCGGAPLRSIELEALLVCITANACREIFTVGGLILIAFFYSK